MDHQHRTHRQGQHHTHTPHEHARHSHGGRHTALTPDPAGTGALDHTEQGEDHPVGREKQSGQPEEQAPHSASLGLGRLPVGTWLRAVFGHGFTPSGSSGYGPLVRSHMRGRVSGRAHHAQSARKGDGSGAFRDPGPPWFRRYPDRSSEIADGPCDPTPGPFCTQAYVNTRMLRLSLVPREVGAGSHVVLSTHEGETHCPREWWFSYRAPVATWPLCWRRAATPNTERRSSPWAPTVPEQRDRSWPPKQVCPRSWSPSATTRTVPSGTGPCPTASPTTPPTWWSPPGSCAFSAPPWSDVTRRSTSTPRCCPPSPERVRCVTHSPMVSDSPAPPSTSSTKVSTPGRSSPRWGSPSRTATTRPDSTSASNTWNGGCWSTRSAASLARAGPSKA